MREKKQFTVDEVEADRIEGWQGQELIGRAPVPALSQTLQQSIQMASDIVRREVQNKGEIIYWKVSSDGIFDILSNTKCCTASSVSNKPAIKRLIIIKLNGDG